MQQMSAMKRSHSFFVRLLRRHGLIVFPWIALSAMLHAWFLPGRILGDDFTPPPPQSSWMLQHHLPWPSLWDPTFALGHDVTTWAPSFPLWFLSGLFGDLGCSWSVIERLLWLFPLFVLLAVAPYALIWSLTRSSLAATSAALLFAMNTWTVGLLQRGHVPSLIACALIPLLLLAIRAAFVGDRWASIRLAALFSLQIFYDIRYAYMSLICMAIATLWWLSSEPRRLRIAMAVGASDRAVHSVWGRLATQGGWWLAGVVAMNLFWMLPALGSTDQHLRSIASGSSLLTFSSPTSWLSALSLYFPYYHYVVGSDPFLVSPVEPLFLLLPLLWLCGLWTAPTWAHRSLMLVASLAATLLIADHNTVLAIPIQWVLHHVPGMVMFRDTNKFFAIVILCYAVSCGYAVAALERYVQRQGMMSWLTSRLPNFQQRLVVSSAAVIVVALLGVTYLWAMRAAYDPLRGSNYAAHPLRPQDRALLDLIGRDQPYRRTLFVPVYPPTLVSTVEHPLVSLSDFRSDVLDPYPYDSFLAYLRSPFLPELCARFGIDRFVVTDDWGEYVFHHFGYAMSYADTVAMMQRLPWLHQERRIGRYVVFHVRMSPQPLFAAPTTPALLFGSPDDMTAVATTAVWAQDPGVIDTSVWPLDRDLYARLSFAQSFLPQNRLDGLWTASYRQDDARLWHPTLRAREHEGTSYRAVVFTTAAFHRLFAPEFDPVVAHGSFRTNQAARWRVKMFADPFSSDERLLAYVDGAGITQLPFQAAQEVTPLDRMPLTAMQLSDPLRFPADSIALPVSTAVDGRALRIDVPNRGLFGGSREAIFQAMPVLDLPLQLHPVVVTHASSPVSPYTLLARLLVRHAASHEIARIDVPLVMSSGVSRLDMTMALQSVLDRRWLLCGDPCRAASEAMLPTHLRAPAEAEDYHVVGLGLVVRSPEGLSVPLETSVRIASVAIEGSAALLGRSAAIRSTRPLADASIIETEAPGIHRISRRLDADLLERTYTIDAPAFDTLTVHDLRGARIHFITNDGIHVFGRVLRTTPQGLEIQSNDNVETAPTLYANDLIAKVLSIENYPDFDLDIALHASSIDRLTYDAEVGLPMRLLPWIGFRSPTGVQFVPASHAAVENGVLTDTISAMPLGSLVSFLSQSVPSRTQAVHVAIDVANVRAAWGIDPDARPVALRLHVEPLPGAVIQQGESFSLHLARLRALTDAPTLVRVNVAPALTVDGRPLSCTPDCPDLSLDADEHDLTLRHVDDAHTRAVVLESGQPAQTRSATIDQSLILSPSIAFAHVDGEHVLLTLAELYAPGWRAFRSAQDPRLLTPWEMLRHTLFPNDAVRLDTARHVRVDGALNGWMIDHAHGWIVCVYAPSMIAGIGASLSLVLLGVVLLCAQYLPRRSDV